MKLVKGVLNLNIDLRATQDLANYFCEIDELVLGVTARYLANLDDGDNLKTSDQVLFMVSLLRNSDWMSNVDVSCKFRRKKRGLINAGGDILKYVLGTATSQDVDNVIGEINHMEDSLFTTFQRIDSSINELSSYLRNVTLNLNSKLIQDHLHGILNSLHIILNHVHICDTIFSLAHVNVLHHSVIT